MVLGAGDAIIRFGADFTDMSRAFDKALVDVNRFESQVSQAGKKLQTLSAPTTTRLKVDDSDLKTTERERAQLSGKSLNWVVKTDKRELSSLKSDYAALRDKTVKVNVETTGMSSKLGAATGVMGGIAGGAAFAGINMATAGMAGLVGGAVDYMSTIEQTGISFNVMLKDQQKATVLMGQLKELASATPFEFPELAKGAQQLLAFGFTAEEIPKKLTLIGDTASAFNAGALGIETITRALGRMETQGKLSMEDLNMLADVGVPAYKMLAAGIYHAGDQSKVTAGDMETLRDSISKGSIDGAKAGKILEDAMAKDYSGMMDKQSKSFAGLMSTLKDTVNETLGNVMRPAFEWMVTVGLPGLTAGIAAVGKVVTPFVNAFAAMPQGMQLGVVALGALAVAAIPVLYALTKIVGMIKDVGSGVGGFASKITGVLGKGKAPAAVDPFAALLQGADCEKKGTLCGENLASGITKGAGSKAGLLSKIPIIGGLLGGGGAPGGLLAGGGLAAALGPVLIIVLAIAAAFAVLYATSGTFRDMIGGVLNTFKEIFKWVSELTDALMSGDFSKAGELLKSGFKAAIDAIMKFDYGEWARKMITSVKESVTTIGNFFGPMFGKSADTLKNAIIDRVKDFGKWLWDGLTANFDFWENLRTAFIEKVKDFGQWLWSGITAYFDFWTNLRNAFIEKVKDFGQWLWSGLTAYFDFWTNLRNTFISSVSTFGQWLWDGLGTFFTDLGNKLSEAAGNFGRQVAEAANPATYLPAPASDMSKIQAGQTAGGGEGAAHMILTGFQGGGKIYPKAGGRLAVIGEGHEPEYIIPQHMLDSLPHMAGGGVVDPVKGMIQAEDMTWVAPSFYANEKTSAPTTAGTEKVAPTYSFDTKREYTEMVEGLKKAWNPSQKTFDIMDATLKKSYKEMGDLLKEGKFEEASKKEEEGLQDLWNELSKVQGTEADTLNTMNFIKSQMDQDISATKAQNVKSDSQAQTNQTCAAVDRNAATVSAACSSAINQAATQNAKAADQKLVDISKPTQPMYTGPLIDISKPAQQSNNQSLTDMAIEFERTFGYRASWDPRQPSGISGAAGRQHGGLFAPKPGGWYSNVAERGEWEAVIPQRLFGGISPSIMGAIPQFGGSITAGSYTPTTNRAGATGGMNMNVHFHIARANMSSPTEAKEWGKRVGDEAERQVRRAGYARG